LTVLEDRGELKTRMRPSVFMMDLLATVPYYTAYLSQALLNHSVSLTVGSISYYLDPSCFAARGISLNPGLSDRVGKLNLSRTPRRIFKLFEAMLNILVLAVRFLVHCPDVIHVQYLPMLRWSLPFDLWLVRFARVRGAKIILTIHDLLPHDTAELHKTLFKGLYQSVDAIICHSAIVKDRLVAEFGVAPSDISVIPHGPFFYDLPVADPLIHTTAGSPLIVLWQGIVFPYKGVDLLLDAWQQVEASGISAELHIVGTGAPELLDTLRAQVNTLGLQRVMIDFRFISPEELIVRYRSADIVVYPYRAITTSGALATGLALGKAIVASDLPVFRELLLDRENALLVDPADRDQLANALVTLLQDSTMRDRFAARISALDFGDASWRSIAACTAKVYDDVCGLAQRSEEPCR
jgi:glycosyltransferase involved in cell wall biosynthesis